MQQADFYRGAEAVGAALAGAAAEQAAAVAAQALDRLLSAPGRPHAACARDCTACCHHPVGISFAEALALRQAVLGQPAPAAAALRQRIADADATTAARSFAALAAAALPCPLLVDGGCAVHGARPLPCRALFSADADACAAALGGERLPRGVPFDAGAFAFGLGAAAAMATAAAADGLPAGRHELRSALAAMLRLGDGADVVALATAFAGSRPVGMPEPGAGDGSGRRAAPE